MVRLNNLKIPQNDKVKTDLKTKKKKKDRGKSKIRLDGGISGQPFSGLSKDVWKDVQGS